jgi:hypothetical protein
MRLAFTKMHGLGNDFIVFDAADPDELPSPAALRRLADRRTGIGFDQALVLAPPRRDGTDVFYRIFNADGSEKDSSSSVQSDGSGTTVSAKTAKSSSDRPHSDPSDRQSVCCVRDCNEEAMRERAAHLARVREPAPKQRSGGSRAEACPIVLGVMQELVCFFRHRGLCEQSGVREAKAWWAATLHGCAAGAAGSEYLRNVLALARGHSRRVCACCARGCQCVHAVCADAEECVLGAWTPERAMACDGCSAAAVRIACAGLRTCSARRARCSNCWDAVEKSACA